MPSAATARPTQCGDARQASRSAISVKPIGKASVGDPRRHARARSSSPAARSLQHEREAADREHHRDRRRRAKPPTTCATVGDAALGQELAGGEREQLAFARRDRGAEQADPERQRWA